MHNEPSKPWQRYVNTAQSVSMPVIIKKPMKKEAVTVVTGRDYEGSTGTDGTGGHSGKINRKIDGAQLTDI